MLSSVLRKPRDAPRIKVQRQPAVILVYDDDPVALYVTLKH